jgi:outer membrane protein assembly factor BamB
MHTGRHFLLRCALILCGAIALFPFIADAANKGGTTPGSPPVPGAGSLPGDWPTYGHDPQRTGYNPDETTINAANAHLLTQAWQSNIGLGETEMPAFSAPSVANGRVYIAGSRDQGDNFFSFDTGDGHTAWSASIGRNPSECFGVGIGSTAAVSGTMVSIGGGDGAYYGFNAGNGSQLWRDPLGVGPSGFAWTSPLMANGQVYMGVASDCDNPSVRGELRSLDPATGGHVNSLYIVPAGQSGGGIWNSPALSPDGSKVIIASGEDYNGYDGPYNRAMMVLDANTLQVLAANKQGATGQDLDWGTTPIIFHDKNGRQLVGAGHKNGIFYAYDLNNVNNGPVWSRQPGPDTGSALAYDPTFQDGGTLFLGSGQYLYALDPVNGGQRWARVSVGETHGGIAVANGLIYLDNNGTLEILKELDGSVVRSITPPNSGISFAGPVVSNGTVYWTSGAYLNAWSLTGPAPTATPTATPAPPPCPGERFIDVCPPDYFYAPVHALNDDGIVSGYTTAPPCRNSLWIPCFNPYNNGTRGQVSKIVSLAAGFGEPPTGQSFEDVPPGSTFYTYTQRLASRGLVDGYACGGPNEPCNPPANRPYFRPNNIVTRGQLSKITANAFSWVEPVDTQQFEDVQPGSTFYTHTGRLYSRNIIMGYPCGGPDEPCGPNSLPYFRPNNEVTRGQTAKIVQLARVQPTPTSISKSSK